MKVGVKADVAERERSFLLTRVDGGQCDCTVWQVDRQLERIAYQKGSAGSKLGTGGDSIIRYCKAWQDWLLSGGKSGQEPPQEGKDLFAYFGAWQQTAMGTPEYKAAAVKVHDQIAKVLYVIGIVGQAPWPVTVKNEVENVFPADVYSGKTKLWWGAANWFWQPWYQEQWFLKS